jgi:large repetitive protein
MTLGGTIFNDADNSSTFQSGTESTFNSVALTLFEDEGNGVFDGTETQLDITGSLAGTDPDDDVDNDDNGTHLGATTTAVVSQAITLINNSEVAIDGDADANTNFSLDFGVFGRTNITVDKNGPATVIAGSSTGNLVYTIDVTNTSGIAATGVTMTDAMLLNLPAGVSFLSTSLPAEFNQGTAVWSIGALAAGATEQITITLTVDATAADTLQVSNTAVVAANELETDPNDNDDTVVTDIDRSINITVDKSGPATVIAGCGAGNLVYAIDVTNDGPSNATGETMSDALLTNLPAGVSLVSTSLPREFNATTGVWNIGDLAIGATEHLTVTLTVEGVASDTLSLTNVSVVAANETETTLVDNTDSVTTEIDRRINLTVDKDGPATVVAGSSAGNLVYTIDVTNAGPSNATGVTMSDALLLNLPAGVAFVSTSLPSEFGIGTSVWNIGDLAAGAT